MSDEEFNKKYNSGRIAAVYSAPQQPQYTLQPAPAQASANTTAKESFEAKTERLRQLKDLLDAEAITQEEFDEMKRDVLNN